MGNTIRIKQVKRISFCLVAFIFCIYLPDNILHAQITEGSPLRAERGRRRHEIPQEDIVAAHRWFAWGRFYYQEDKLEKAEECLKKALELDPFNHSADSLLAALQSDSAENETVLEKDLPEPENRTGPFYQWYVNGMMRYKRGELYLAEAAFENALEYDEDSEVARQMLYRVKRELGYKKIKVQSQPEELDYAEVLSEAKTKGEYDKDDAWRWYQHARFLMDVLNDSNNAEICAKIALELDPELEQALQMTEAFEAARTAVPPPAPDAEGEKEQMPVVVEPEQEKDETSLQEPEILAEGGKTSEINQKPDDASQTITEKIIHETLDTEAQTELISAEDQELKEDKRRREEAARLEAEKKRKEQEARIQAIRKVEDAERKKAELARKEKEKIDKARERIAEALSKADDLVGALKLEEADKILEEAFDIAYKADPSDIRSPFSLFLLKRKTGDYKEALRYFLEALELYSQYKHRNEKAYKDYEDHLDCFVRGLVIQSAVNAYNIRNPEKILTPSSNGLVLPRLVHAGLLEADLNREVLLDIPAGTVKRQVNGLRCNQGGHSYYFDAMGNVSCRIHGTSPMLLNQVAINEE